MVTPGTHQHGPEAAHKGENVFPMSWRGRTRGAAVSLWIRADGTLHDLQFCRWCGWGTLDTLRVGGGEVAAFSLPLSDHNVELEVTEVEHLVEHEGPKHRELAEQGPLSQKHPERGTDWQVLRLHILRSNHSPLGVFMRAGGPATAPANALATATTTTTVPVTLSGLQL